MKAVVYYGPGDIRLENAPELNRKNDNMIAEVACCAICGSDLKMWLSGNSRCRPPRVIGHEMAGRLVHVGSGMKGFLPGQRITLATTVGCGKCYYCRNGMSNLCENAILISNATDGAFARYIEIPPQAVEGGNVILLPDDLSDEWAALSEPLSCAINGQRLAGVAQGASVLIIGGGALGALHAELAKARGAAEVMISEISEKRLELLKRLKGVDIIDGRTRQVEEEVRKRTGGRGADIAIVCAPVRDAHEQAIRCVRKGGSVCFFASIPKGASDITIDSRTIHYSEIKITGVSDSRPEHVSDAVKLLADGKIDADAIITHRLPIERVLEGLELMRSGESLKVLIYPEGIKDGSSE